MNEDDWLEMAYEDRYPYEADDNYEDRYYEANDNYEEDET